MWGVGHKHIAREARCAQGSKQMARGVGDDTHVLALERTSFGIGYGSINPQSNPVLPLTGSGSIHYEVVCSSSPCTVAQTGLQRTD